MNVDPGILETAIETIQRLRKAIVELDDMLCDIASGDQGSFVPESETVSAAQHAIQYCRKVYPLEDRK